MKYYPLNFYAQIRVFENINTEKLSKSDIIEIFDKNKDMLYKYYNNKNILIKYLKLSEQLNMYDWVNFFKFFLNINEIDRDILDEEISYFKKTNDKDLLKLISKVEESIL